MKERWHQEAIIYGVDVLRYFDSNGDGYGDFKGLTQKLDYIHQLGVNCIWLLPFFESPRRDNGYDVTDYYQIDPRAGDFGDFVEFTEEAAQRGIRVIVDLVVNHSSNEHPWFKASVERIPPYEDYYIWSKKKPSEKGEMDNVFDAATSVWKYHPKRKEYYHHSFYDFQPDLNHLNPELNLEIKKIMSFWLKLGISGFRVDAAYFIGRSFVNKKIPHNTHELLRDWHDHVSWQKGDAILLGEVDLIPQETLKYFGTGDEFHAMYNFLLNAYFFLAFAQEEKTPIIQGLNLQLKKPDSCQWVNFLRNLDELNLHSLEEYLRKDVYKKLEQKKNAQIFERGLRRRLAPLLGVNSRIKMAFSLMFSLPGSPMLVYGDEIGMGDNLNLPGRESVRTPMQWNAEKNAGFSSVPSDQLISPIINRGEFSYKNVNVETQSRDRKSLLSSVKLMINIRKSLPKLSNGDIHIIETGDKRVLGHQVEDLLFFHNFSDQPLEIELSEVDLNQYTEVCSDDDYKIRKRLLKVNPYGFRWFKRLKP